MIGTDSLSYKCIVNHGSLLSRRPISGATYWIQAGDAYEEWKENKFYETDLYLGLREHPYTLDFDELLQIQKIFYHTIQLEFIIDRDDIDNYLVTNYRDQ